MRPLLRLQASPQLPRLPAHDALMQAHGPFCHMCERRLNAGGRVWQCEQDFFVTEDRVTTKDWPHLLLLCTDCAQAHENATRREPTGALLLPQRTTTFALHPNSPFQYQLEKITLVLTGDEAAPESALVIPAVIVTGATPEAQRTIEHFALNTPYYDPQKKRLTVSAEDRKRPEFDLRMQVRTEVWLTAQEMARALAQLEGQTRAADLARFAADTSGFWATWLTVFNRLMRDPAQVAAIFTPGLTDGLAPPPSHQHNGTNVAYLQPPPNALPVHLDLS